MKESTKKGLSFGLTSGIITTVGIMIGLAKATNSRTAVIGGILTVAIADAFSDAFGMHNSEESEKKNSSNSIRKTTISTFFAKSIVALSFLIAVIFVELNKAIIINLIYALILLNIFTYKIAKMRKESISKEMLIHTSSAVIVITITYFVGILVGKYF